MVDLAGVDPWRGHTDHDGAVSRPRASVADPEATDRAGAGRAVFAGTGRYAVVGRRLGRAALCGRTGSQASGAAGAAVPFSALRARAVGLRRVSRLLCADGRDVDRGGVR